VAPDLSNELADTLIRCSEGQEVVATHLLGLPQRHLCNAHAGDILLSFATSPPLGTPASGRTSHQRIPIPPCTAGYSGSLAASPPMWYRVVMPSYMRWVIRPWEAWGRLWQWSIQMPGLSARKAIS